MIIFDSTKTNIALDLFGRINLSTHQQFKSGSEFTAKADQSPVTETDLANHRVLSAKLPELVDVPVLSEENYPSYADRRDLKNYWLVDPLDGTKEFINGHPDFSVLIALISDARPIFSAILVPVTSQVFFAEKGRGTCLYTDGKKTSFASAPPGATLRGLTSRFHTEPEVEKFYDKHRVVGRLSRGSALKFCALVTGEADVYYRHFGPHEWDVAAGDLLISESGGTFISLASGGPLRYGAEATRVDSFLAASPGLNVLEWRKK